MSKTLRITLAVSGATLIVAGLIVGLMPFYAGTSYSGIVNCGSQFAPAPLGSLNGPAMLTCAAARSTRTAITWALVGPGILLDIAALFAWAREGRVQTWSTPAERNATP